MIHPIHLKILFLVNDTITGPNHLRLILFKLTQVMKIQDFNFKLAEFWHHDTSLMPQSG